MKRNHFESGCIKHEIRSLICRQVMMALAHNLTQDLRVSSLPGKYWDFESRLIGGADVFGVPVRIEAFENDAQIYKAGNAFCSGERTSFGANTVDYHKGEFTYHPNSNLVWADYCGAPRWEYLQDYIEWSNQRKDWSLGYATFGLFVRRPTCLPMDLIPTWNANTGWDEKAQAVVEYISSRLAVPHRLVFKYLYNHEEGLARMLTVGFELNPSRLPGMRTIAEEKSAVVSRKAAYKPKFTDGALVEKIWELRAVQGLPAKTVASQLGISTRKLAGIQVSLLYRQRRAANC